jgi:hypothetical protein
MKIHYASCVISMLLACLPELLTAQHAAPESAIQLRNWTAASYFQLEPPADEHAKSSVRVNQATVLSSNLVFVGIVPCRLVDTRDGNLPAGFGPPVMAGNTIRTIQVPAGGHCAIPATAQAYSVNFTVVPRGFLGYLTAWPTPNRPANEVSILNSFNGQVIANAAVVPAGTNGAIDVFVSNLTDVIIDINGYYIPQVPSGGGVAVPPGVVVAFGGDIIPAGWLLCDGAVLDRTNPLYTPLFNAIGTAHGGDGSPNFRIPDYRGLFLRGVNRTLSPARDPDADARVRPAPDGTGNPGNKVGSLQVDSFKSHNHGGGNHSHNTGTQNGAAPQFGGLIVRIPGDAFGAATSTSGTIINSEGGAETRPLNAYVQYIIKL